MTTIGHHGLLFAAAAPPPAATIALNGWTETGTSSMSKVIPFGVTMTSGVRVILQFVGRPNQTGTVNTPSGWTLLDQQNQGGTNQQVTTFYRDCNGTEGTTVTVTHSLSTPNVSAMVYRIPAGSYDASQAPQIGTSAALTTTPDPPSLSPSWGSASCLVIATYSSRSDAVPPASYPLANGQTSQAGSQGGAGANGNRADIAACWDSQTGTTFNPAAFGTIPAGSSRACVTQTIAIKL